MKSGKVNFSIAGHAAWAPGIETPEAWLAWAKSPFRIGLGAEPGLRAMPPMLRRRVGFLGKMALESAYGCLDDAKDVPTVFCSRHGEVSRSLDMLSALAAGEPLSPASFGLSVHNAIGGLFSIARAEKTNMLALAGGASSVETAVVEACGLLADGEKQVLLVVYDCPLPSDYAHFQDTDEQHYSWAWLMEPAGENTVSLSWTHDPDEARTQPGGLPGGLDIFRAYLSGEQMLERACGRQRWRWSWNA